MTAVTQPASINHDGQTLRFAGTLLRGRIAGLWSQLPPSLSDVREFDLHAIDHLDSAGLAMLSLLATRCGKVTIHGQPQGYLELRAAYRLDEHLDFSRG